MAALFLMSGCAVTPRLDVKFDADPPGEPSSTPAPTPPSDVLNWRIIRVFTASIVAAPGGGQWAQVKPLPAFTSSPDDRREFLIAVTEPFTTNPAANIRGSVRLRLDALGTVGVGLRLLQGERTLDFIGGFELSNFLPPAGGSVHAIHGFEGERFGDIFGLPSSGPISAYNPGDVIDVNWTLDQASRTFSAGVLGGPVQSSSFPAVSRGVATTPIQRLEIYLWMQKPTSETVVFIDNLRVEEYR